MSACYALLTEGMSHKQRDELDGLLAGAGDDQGRRARVKAAILAGGDVRSVSRSPEG